MQLVGSLKSNRSYRSVNYIIPEMSTTQSSPEFVFEKLEVHREGGVLFAAINAPPMNLLGPELIRDLVSLIQQAEANETVKVVVFKSADPDYFISHVDVTRIKENREAAAKLDGAASIGLMLRHLSTSRLVSIAQIEGRVRGVGSEFIMAHRIARFPAAGHAVVKERVNAICLPSIEDIRRDSDLFLEGTRTNEFQQLTQAAMENGFQTRAAEMNLAKLVDDIQGKTDLRI
jgi:enoyl-CoA hydratase/carnithine racemase